MLTKFDRLNHRLSFHFSPTTTASGVARSAASSIREACTFDSLEYVGKLIVQYIPKHRAVESLRPDDFRKLRNGLVKNYAPTNTRVNMSRIRSIFKFAYDEQLITKPVLYGRGFDSPTKATIRKARNAKPKKLFEPEQIHTLLLDNATPAMKAMIYLAINTGMNNADSGQPAEVAH